jgi:AcrR family transcriptional regulator
MRYRETLARMIQGKKAAARRVARELGVTEGALRYHFRKGVHPRELMRIACELFWARQGLVMLPPAQRRAVEREVRRAAL